MALLSVDQNGKITIPFADRTTTPGVVKLTFPKKLDAMPRDNDTGFI